MIVKGITRKATGAWKTHLIRADNNEAIRIVATEGLAATSIPDMVQELDDYAIGTRCQKPLFEVIINPDRRGPGGDDDKRAALDMVLEKYPGLKDVPFFIVGHTKDGVEHWHVVFARCQPGQNAVALPHTKIKLMDVSAAMYARMELEPPEGVTAFIEGDRDRQRNDIDHKTFKAAERQGIDARDLSAVAVEAWKSGDFAAEMRKAGYELAKGDRRGFVLVDHAGNVISLRGLLKPLDLKAKDIRAALGPEEQAQTIEDAQAALQPPDRTTASTFNAMAAKSGVAVERIALKQALQTKKAALDELKEKQRLTQIFIEETLADINRAYARAHQYARETGEEFWWPSSQSPAQTREVVTKRMLEKQMRDRQALVDEIKRDREQLKRLTLRQHAERIVEMARATLDRLAERFKPKPAPAKPLPQDSQAKPVSPIPGRPTAEQFREAFRDMGQESDRGRERTITPPRQPTRPKGPGV